MLWEQSFDLRREEKCNDVCRHIIGYSEGARTIFQKKIPVVLKRHFLHEYYDFV